ncbi:MAG: cob(I)yrinic acid a,c-diamide adenosyltransferase [Gemmatimonadota bacterium]
MKIYTRRGDRGETSLFGGVRVAKADPRVAAYGTIDELNAALGLALALDADGLIDDAALDGVQADLFTLGARLAAARPEEAARKGSIPVLAPARVNELERRIDRLEAELPPLDAFVLPGGSAAAAQLHVARTVCRRAERAITALLASQPDLGDLVVPYINRLSDLLYSLARATNLRAGREESRWEPVRRRPPGETGAREGDGS